MLEYRCLKVFFWSTTINVTTVTIFLELPRRAHLLWKEGLGIALRSCQGTERKNADSKNLSSLYKFGLHNPPSDLSNRLVTLKYEHLLLHKKKI